MNQEQVRIITIDGYVIHCLIKLFLKDLLILFLKFERLEFVFLKNFSQVALKISNLFTFLKADIEFLIFDFCQVYNFSVHVLADFVRIGNAKHASLVEVLNHNQVITHDAQESLG